MAPSKLLAVYSAIPLVLLGHIVIMSGCGPSGLNKVGAIKSASAGFLSGRGTGGQLAGSEVAAYLSNPGCPGAMGCRIWVLKVSVGVKAGTILAQLSLSPTNFVYKPAPPGLKGKGWPFS